MAGQCGGSPEKSGKWRACVDYIDLNEACPKDNFPLPRIGCVGRAWDVVILRCLL